MTIAAFLIGLSVLIFFINFFRSLKHGELATGNVWNSRSPEWQVPSPMPVHNYEVPFEVVGERRKRRPFGSGEKDDDPLPVLDAEVEQFPGEDVGPVTRCVMILTRRSGGPSTHSVSTSVGASPGCPCPLA